ncbi:MAG TPA: NAD-dependent epimerase/dehydratase family protein [Planctomycetota bacterium]|nr:NAD-dependent epimerase/dehydratase family protein [Planctomycetota bacterium]
MQKILITGGAGFVGSNLALRFKQSRPAAEVIAFDNLRRRGSELILSRLRAGGVTFLHGDVRVREDLLAAGQVDLVVDCAAEPSVLAGRDGSPDYVIQTNLVGTVNCLELARRCGADVVFLSTSRVYPSAPINALKYREVETRFQMLGQTVRGASEHGLAEDFPLEGSRSLYGASKLASELLLEEYREAYGLRAVVNRCGVLTGPWQMGKVDQGVVVLWVAKHLYRGALSYIGFSGTGKQVRDILHVQDLYDLLEIQLGRIAEFDGSIFNVGGGTTISISLQELTALCREYTGNSIPIGAVPETRPQDLICYLSDCRKVQAATGWRAHHSPESIIEEIARWITDHRAELEPILA